MTTLRITARHASGLWGMRVGALLQLSRPDRITHLRVECNTMDVPLMTEVLRLCKNISDVAVRTGTDRLDEQIFRRVAKIRNLRRLSIKAPEMDRGFVVDALDVDPFPKLEHLELQCDTGRLRWNEWKVLGRLTSLNVALSDDELQSTLPLLTRMTELRVTMTVASAESLRALCARIAERVPALTTLEMRLVPEGLAIEPVRLDNLSPLMKLKHMRHASMYALTGLAGDHAAFAITCWSHWSELESWDIQESPVVATDAFLSLSMSLAPSLRHCKMKTPAFKPVDLALWTRWYGAHARICMLPDVLGPLNPKTLHMVDWGTWLGLRSTRNARFRARISVLGVTPVSALSRLLPMMHHRPCVVLATPMIGDGPFVRGLGAASAPCTWIVCCERSERGDQRGDQRGDPFSNPIAQHTDWAAGSSGQHAVVVAWIHSQRLVERKLTPPLARLVAMCVEASPRFATAQEAHAHVFENKEGWTIEDDAFGLPNVKIHVRLRGAWFGNVCQIQGGAEE